MTEKKKQNPIPLSLKERKRWIKIKLNAETNLPVSALKEIKFHYNKLLGLLLLSRSNLKLINLKEDNLIVKCNLNYLNEVIIASIFLKEVNGVKVSPVVMAISGTINALKKNKTLNK